MVQRHWIIGIAGLAMMAILIAWYPRTFTGEGWSGGNISTFNLLPFGPKQLPSGLFGKEPFSGAYVNAGSAFTLMRRLERARAARMHLILRLDYAEMPIRNPDRTFSVKLWERNIDRLRSIDLEPYVADGTVIGAELINEPHVASKWGGKIISKEQLESAAAYAKSIWPYLPVGAGRSDYVLRFAPWKYLDFSHSQYHMRKGDIETWRKLTVAQSKAAGVALLLSLNFYGGEVGNKPMMPAEIRRLGSSLAADTYACALTGYMYNKKYFSEPGIEEAFAAVAAVASSHPSPPCYVRAVKH